MNSELKKLIKLKKEAIKNCDFELACKYRDKEISLMKELGIQVKVNSKLNTNGQIIAKYISDFEKKYSAEELSKVLSLLNHEPPVGTRIYVSGL